MKGLINIKQKKNDDFMYSLKEGMTPFSYEIDIRTDLNKEFLSLFNVENFKEEIELQKNYFGYRDEKKFYDKWAKKEEYLLKGAEYVSFEEFSLPEISLYIKRNPILKTKKILFKNVRNLDFSVVQEIEKYFGEDTHNINFLLQYNSEIITFDEYKKTIQKITEMAEEIKSYNFSPMEEVMYAYDLVRNRVYTKENIDDKKNVSRDLTSVLFGSKIVCVGYANIFKALLDKLEIKNDIASLFTPEGEKGHARNEVYIKDDKYDIDGVYFFDATFDSKKKEDDESYLLSYPHFAKTKKEMNNLDKEKLIQYAFLDASPESYYNFEKFMEDHKYEDIKQDDIMRINHMSLFVNDKRLLLENPIAYQMLPNFLLDKMLLPKEEFMEEVARLYDLYNRPIEGETLMEVLFNVRKELYYNNQEEYQFSIEDMRKIALLSNWEFQGTLEEELYKLMNIKEQDKLKVNNTQFNRYLEKRELAKELERVKLAKVIKEDYQRKR